MKNFYAMQSFVPAAALIALLFSSCRDNGQPLEEVVPEPQVEVRLVRAYGDGVEFELKPLGALELTYLVTEASRGLPTYDRVISLGTPAEHTQRSVYQRFGLKPNTEYIVSAAARRWNEKSELTSISVYTTDTLPGPTISVTAGRTTSSALYFTVNSAPNADLAKYFVTSKPVPPSADNILSYGNIIYIEEVPYEVEVTNTDLPYMDDPDFPLSPDTEYYVYIVVARASLTSRPVCLEMKTTP